MPFGAFPLQAATISVGGLSLFSTEVAEMTAKTYMPKIWLTPVQVRDKLQISRSKFYLEILAGMPHVRIGRSIRISEAKLDAWLSSKRG